MIEIASLTKRFGDFTAVDHVSFKVEQGEVVGFLGPNGAGKSTTMKMVTGYLIPTSGTAKVCGHDVVAEPIAAKDRIGYLPEGAPAYPDMTPEGFLRFTAEVRGFKGADKKKRVDEAAAKAQLAGVMRQSIETLSKGYKRRVGIAQAILHDPDVLIMDEPTDGLDPNQKHEVRSLIRSMAPGKAIVLSTHILEEVEAVCSRVIIIARGKVIFDGTPAKLQARSRYHNAVDVCVRGVSPVALKDELARIAGVSEVEPVAATNGQARCVVVPKHGQSVVAEIGRLVRAKNWEVDEIRVESGRLDEVFRTLTGGEVGARS